MQKKSLKIVFRVGALPGIAAWLGLGSPSICFADGICDYYKQHMPQFYEIVCKGGKGGGRAGEAYSSFADSFNLNPASIPTEPSPYGLESIGSFPRAHEISDAPTRNYSFAMIKGFHKVGTAVSTASNMTFYGNDILQRTYGLTTDANIRNPETARGYLTNLNLGSSVALPLRLGRVRAPALGFSLRYNKITNTIGWGTGLSAVIGPLVLGFGIAREQVSNFLPQMTFYSGVMGINFLWVEVEYTFLQSQDGPVLGPVQILTATVPVYHFLFSVAARRLNYLEIGEVIQMHYAAQFQVNRNFAVGYLFNYLPGANSLALQLFI